jgi:GNAT superfamily N-acetyltransferase
MQREWQIHTAASMCYADLGDRGCFIAGAEWADKNPASIKIEKQRWDGYDKYVIWAEHGSVQLEVHDKPYGEYNIEAWLFSLWVDEDSRKSGLGKQLRELAEQIAHERGCKTVCLEWSKREAPYWVREWYERNGYKIRAFIGGSSLMLRKEL